MLLPIYVDYSTGAFKRKDAFNFRLSGEHSDTNVAGCFRCGLMTKPRLRLFVNRGLRRLRTGA